VLTLFCSGGVKHTDFTDSLICNKRFCHLPEFILLLPAPLFCFIFRIGHVESITTSPFPETTVHDIFVELVDVLLVICL